MSGDRSTFKHAAVYSAAAMLGRLIGFLLLPLYAHEFQTIGYGIIGMVDTAMNFLLSLLSTSIRGGLTRFYHEQETEEAKGRVVVTGTLLVAAACTVLVLLLALLSRPVSAFMLGDGDYWLLLTLGGAGFLFATVGDTASTLLVIRRRSMQYSVVSLVSLVLGLTLNFLFIIVFRWGVLGFFLAGLASAMIVCGVYVTILIRSCGWGYDPEIARKLIAFQLPLVPGSLASFFARQAERILVRFFHALEGVGVLEMGYKFPVLLTLLIHQPFMRSWDTRRVEIAEEPDGPERIGRMYTYGLFLMLAAGLIMAVCIHDLLKIITPEDFWPAHRIAKVEILTVLIQSSMYHFIFGIFYHKHTGQWAKVRGVTAFVKVGLSVLFIGLWGLYGAAYSACAGALILLVWGGRIGMRYYAFPIEKAKVFSMIATAATLFVLIQGADPATWSWLDPVRTGWIPGLGDLLNGTFLGTWKEGKVITLLLERTDPLADMFGRGLAACVFLLMLPVMHDATRVKAARLLRLRRG